MKTALILSHYPQPEFHTGAVGSIPNVLSDLGLKPVIRSFVTGHEPTDVEPDVLFVMGSLDSTLNTDLAWLRRERAYVQKILATGIPVMGICFGGQLIAEILGGNVSNSIRAEEGFYVINPLPVPGLENFVKPGPWVELHYQQFSLPPGAHLLAETEICNQAFLHGNALGTQFHIEFTVESAHLHFALEPRLVPPQHKEDFLARLDTDADLFFTQARELVSGFLTQQSRDGASHQAQPLKPVVKGPLA